MRLVLHHCVIQSKQHVSNRERNDNRGAWSPVGPDGVPTHPPASSTWNPCDPQKLTCYNFKFHVKLKRVYFSFFFKVKTTGDFKAKRELIERKQPKKKERSNPTPHPPHTRVTMLSTISHIHRPWNDNTFRVTFFSPPSSLDICIGPCWVTSSSQRFSFLHAKQGAGEQSQK